MNKVYASFGIRRGPITLEEGEYWGDDGIPRCQNCGGKRRTINPYDPNEWEHMMCDCQRAEFDKRQAEFKDRTSPNLLKESRLPQRYHSVKFGVKTIAQSKAYSDVVTDCTDYCTKGAQGKGVYLWGISGVGKTHIMACMINELTARGQRCLFVTMSELADIDNSWLKEKAKTVKYLFIDDLGAERIAKDSNRDTWMQSVTFEVINARYGRQLPTIFSSNYSMTDLAENKGLNERTISRMKEMCKIYHLQGDSFRK